MANTKKSDLYVVTKLKELTKYVITVTEKSPKKFRFTLVVRLQNYCLDVIENLVLANMLPTGSSERLGKKETGNLLELLVFFP